MGFIRPGDQGFASSTFWGCDNKTSNYPGTKSNAWVLAVLRLISITVCSQRTWE